MKKLLLISLTILSFLAVRADEGMWLLSLLKQNNIERMHELGFKLTAEDIYSLNQPGIKDAVVGLGRQGRPFRHFCSAEIVSDKGLLITNHHCGFGMIQDHSSVENDYLSNGFWAYKMEDELSNPGITASILERMEDVSDRILPLLKNDMTSEERTVVVDSVGKLIVEEAVGNSDLKGQVIGMFNGNQYFLLLYTIYKDVRLVGAPPQSMGKFGGDFDNWMWPRHTCDFSMFRIYTGPDGRPAEYSTDNIPLKPKHHFPISIKGVEEGDFAMIMGFPGSTDRFLTSFGLTNTMENNDIRYNVRTVRLQIMKEDMQKSDKVRIQYASKYAGVANYWKNAFEQNKALKKLNTMKTKEDIEQEFTQWVNADASRKAEYGDALELISDGYKANAEYNRVRTYVSEALGATETSGFATGITKDINTLCDNNITSDKKAEAKGRIMKKAVDFYKNFDPTIEQNIYASLYKIYSDEVSEEFYPEIIKLVNKKYSGDYVKFAEEVSKKSIFMDESRLNAFLEKPNIKKFDEDLAVIAGKSFSEVYYVIRDKMKPASQEIQKGDRLFVKGLLAMNPDKFYSPDANSTLRLTYGQVKGYKPRDAVYYDYYTTLTGVMEKEGAKGTEFEVPARLKELYAASDYGQYATDNNLHVNFISDNDITGGNSGSPVINANGELIGAAFDGNSEAMSGDIDFEENLQRCINVDMRYVLFVIDVYAGAKNLIEEMTIVK
ncbi:MAG: S46 family peptidase [Culturomica sp.]|jgi:hypothetical protein|nr:S46 family peptidase [Culturomica sp.]